MGAGGRTRSAFGASLMLHLEPPEKPDDFDARMQPYRDDIEQGVDDPEAPDFPPRWGAYKAHFSRAQSGKCGYCELPVVAGQDGDVEHFRPKGAVWAIENEGREIDNLGNVRGRTPNKLSPRGYWFMAYQWDNYLLSCANCNRKWKRSFFPVKDTPRKLPPNKNTPEDELVLNPYGRKDPANHLEFDREGGIKARNGSIYGRATIKVCGLHRPTLSGERWEKSGIAHGIADQLEAAKASGDREKKQTALRDFYRAAGDARNQHRGLVRAVLKQRCGMSWKDLEEALGI